MSRSVFGEGAAFVLRILARAERPLRRGEIVKMTELSGSGVAHILADLEDVGVVQGDLPPELRTGQSVGYTLDRERLDAIIEQRVAFIRGDDVPSDSRDAS